MEEENDSGGLTWMAETEMFIEIKKKNTIQIPGGAFDCVGIVIGDDS